MNGSRVCEISEQVVDKQVTLIYDSGRRTEAAVVSRRLGPLCLAKRHCTRVDSSSWIVEGQPFLIETMGMVYTRFGVGVY